MNDRSRTIARVQFLGAQRIEIGSDVVTPEAERLFAMIVRLSVPLGRMTSRQTMMDTLWPGADEANGRHNLRQTVYKAREIGLVVESGEDGLRLDPRHWSCDWDDPVGDVAGQWLTDYEPDFSPELVAWIAAQRVGVHALIRPRIIRALQSARSAGDLMIADRHARQLLGIDELNEEATLTRAEFMAMQGAKVDALKLLDAYLLEIGRVGWGRDAALPAQLLRRRIAEKLPALSYQSGGTRHHGPLVGRDRESRRLLAGLFDTRAGRGSALLLQGGDGTGKSRLLYEMKKSALLQGMTVLELACDSAPNPMPFASMRTLVSRVLSLPGAMGVSPEALGTLRAWLASREFAPDDCPVMEIEDLLAAVSEETPLVVMVEAGELMDAETLGRLDRVYRQGVVRYHMLVLTSATMATPTRAPIDLQWVERVTLLPLSTTDVRAIVSAYAAVEQPRATQDQIACASVFAEGVPMFGIEMLGLILDPGSPDVIPWRVQVAVGKAVRELGEFQTRVLTLCARLGRVANQEIIASTITLPPGAMHEALHGLEQQGYLRFDAGTVCISALMSDAAFRRLKPSTVRADALRAAGVLADQLESSTTPDTVYAGVRLLVLAREQVRAARMLVTHAGMLVLNDTAQSIIFELTRIREVSESPVLDVAIDRIVDQIRSGAECARIQSPPFAGWSESSCLPEVSAAAVEMDHTLAGQEPLQATLHDSRNPARSPASRLAEAVTALCLASNIGDWDALEQAYRTVNDVRHAKTSSRYDAERADVIYFASRGAREQALLSAERLAQESRLVHDVQLACRGFRNAAQVFSIYGVTGHAQSLLHESLGLATKLCYPAQAAWADIRLADLCIESMDIEGANSYLNSAQARIDQFSLRVPLLNLDLSLHRSWQSQIAADFPRAQKAARYVCRHTSSTQQGTVLWNVLAVKLATHRGGLSRELNKNFATLKQSIGARPFFVDEPFALAALALFSREREYARETFRFIMEQFPRIESTGRKIWPFLRAMVSD